jgi:hypothetical protein
MGKKPRVFIGSSSEGLEVARNLTIGLSKDCETVLWEAGAFGVSETYIESLEKKAADVEFGVLVVTPDDLREKRGEEDKVPRDNVVFELGLFMGRLGRQRTFIVCDTSTVKLPTDLSGISTAHFDSNRSDGDLRQALVSTAAVIVDAIRQTPRLANAQPNKPLHDALPDADAIYGAVVSWPVGEDDEIQIQKSDTAWTSQLVPSLIYWRMKGVTVRVFAPPLLQQGSVTKAENARRKLLADLGIEFRESANLAISGFFRKARYNEENVAIVVNDQPGDGVPLATRYEGGANASAVEALQRMLLQPDGSAKEATPFVPNLVVQDTAEIFEMLRKGVKQYNAPKVQFQATTLPTKDLLLLSPYARAYKYGQIGRLLTCYEAGKNQPFTALAAMLRSGGKSILTPPVVEMRSDGAVVIDGTTRAAYCFRNDIDKYHCIAVSGVADDLPGMPVSVQRVTTSERSLSQNERTEDYQPALFREIERATHPY